MNLEGSTDILASSWNTPAPTDSEPRKGSTKRTPLFSPSTHRCASFTHAAPRRSDTLNPSPSVRTDDGRAAATSGASLLGEKNQKTSLVSSADEKSSVPRVKWNHFTSSKKKKFLKCILWICTNVPQKLAPAPPEITGSPPPSVPVGGFYTLKWSFYSDAGKKIKLFKKQEFLRRQVEQTNLSKF